MIDEEVMFFIKSSKTIREEYVYELVCKGFARWGLCKLQEKNKRRDIENTTIEKLLKDMKLVIFADWTDTELVKMFLCIIAIGMKGLFFSGGKLKTGIKLKKGKTFLIKRLGIDWWYYDKENWRRSAWGSEI